MEQFKAAPYERSEERTGNRNGFRDRPLTTHMRRIFHEKNLSGTYGNGCLEETVRTCGGVAQDVSGVSK